MRLRLVWAVSLATFVAAAAVVQVGTRPAHSLITIHVHKSGLFSAFGHEHKVTAPIARGKLDTKANTIEIVVAAKQMKVIDADVSEKERAEVQATMLGPSVLDSDKFPEIRFQSSRVEELGTHGEGSGQQYRVTGRLELHGVSKELSFEVRRDIEGAYHGKTKVKQTDFGIQPVSVGGGTVKVKDELDIEFGILASDLSQNTNSK